MNIWDEWIIIIKFKEGAFNIPKGGGEESIALWVKKEENEMDADSIRY